MRKPKTETARKPVRKPASRQPVCSWCQRVQKNPDDLFRCGAGDSIALNPESEGRACRNCYIWIRDGDRNAGWRTANSAPIEVLSLSAAAIVRDRYSAKEIKSGFVFQVEEPEQTVLAVWREQRVGSWESKPDGSYGYQIEEFDTLIPFTLHPSAWGWTKTQIRYFERVWRGVSKIATAGGYL